MRWIWLAVLVACGDNVVPRLAPVTYDLAGVRVESLTVFHDRARDEDCSAVAWADGATYCTPQLAPVAYLDDVCSEAVGMASSGYAPAMFTIAGTTSVRRIYPLVARAAPPQYWTRVDGVCTGPYSPDASMTWGDLTSEELDESAFVRLYTSAPEGIGRLQVIAIDTRDGMHVRRGMHDRELGFDCVFANERDLDQVACTPADAADVLYRDASCTQPVVIAPGAPPRYARLGCDAYGEVGAAIDVPLYEATTSGCQAAGLPAGWQIYDVGAPVDLAYATRVRHGSGRIQPIELVAATARVPDGVLHDTMLDADCGLAPVEGQLRCVPATVGIETYFTDETCATERDIAVLHATCGAPERFAFRDAYHAIGEVVSDALYVPSTGDRCMLQPPVGEPHAVGPALPPETFVPAL